MFVYNKVTELVYDQFLLLFLFEIVVLLFAILPFKKKLNFRTILFSSIIAIVISLLSMMIVNGFYGGMAYHERFGWPFPFQWTSRSIDDISTPWGLRFEPWKFLTNTIYWSLLPLTILLEIYSNNKNKKYQIFLVATLTIYIILTILFSWYNNRKSLEIASNQISEITTEGDTITDIDLAKRKQETLEKEFPEFKGFEEASSFAGVSVKIQEEGSVHYYAYILHGSGIPILKVTCFRVDRMFRVFKIGEFPDMLDSYIGYMDIDARTCGGITVED